MKRAKTSRRTEPSNSNESECASKNNNGGFPEPIKRDPMKMELVLETIFDFCTVSTLKSCRLVSKQWKDLSLKSWRNKAVLIQCEKRTEGRVSFREYQQLMKDSDDTHHLKKFPFLGYHLIFAPSQLTMSLESALEPVSILTRDLQLDNCRHTLSCFTRVLLNFHALEKLEINDCDIRENLSCMASTIKTLNTIKRLKISLSDQIYCLYNDQESDYEDLLKCFPKMESFCIETTRPHHVTFILRCFRNIMIPLKKLKIVGFSMMDNQSVTLQNVSKQIIERNFPLERLTLDMEWCFVTAVTGKSFRKLLHEHKDTLQYFKISFEPNPTVHCPIIPKGTQKKNSFESWLGNFKMEKLKEIRIANGFPWCMHLLVLLELPKLEKLILEYAVDSSRISGKMETNLNSVTIHKRKVYENLKTFELQDNRRIPGRKMIEAFTKMMPHLTKLTIPLDKIGFQIVCERLRGLRMLNVLAVPCIYYVELDDESVTGISKTKEKMRGERPPNITNLQHLTDLSISCEVQLQRDDVRFTDHSVTHGFLQLPKLYYLSIAFNGLSKEIEEKLQNHVKGFVDIQQIKTSHDSDSGYQIVEIDSDHEFEETRDPRDDDDIQV